MVDGVLTLSVKGKEFPTNESRRTKDISPKALRGWKSLPKSPDVSEAETRVVVNAGDEALETVVIHGVEEIHDATVAPEDAAEVTGTEIHEVTVVPEDAAVTGAQAHEVAAVRGGRVAREALAAPQ